MMFSLQSHSHEYYISLSFTSRRRVTRKDFSSMNDYDEARKTSYREVRSHWIDIVENYNQAISYFLW